MEEKSQIHKIRHSLAHLLAIQVLKFDPSAKLAIGPVIDNGFYYDFKFSGEKPTEKDLKEFQKGIKKAISAGLDFIYKEISVEEAKELFKNQIYKLELIDELEKAGEKISIYYTGDFVDLCAGPHVLNTREINVDAFEITKLAGSYWRGDENKDQLIRIYGIAFEKAEELDNYKKMLSEAELRDHRKLGKELDLFTRSELVGAGLPLFTPKGTAMREAIVDKINSIQKRFGFQKVWIPHITKSDLYKTSGHWEKFSEELFKVRGRENEFVIKPMNCPHHTQIYASSPKSYKDLPVRYMETTTCYRDEQSGELLGLSRVISLTQDDGHVFCTPEQVEQEIKNIIQVIREFYTELELWKEGSYQVSLSIHDPKNPEKYLGGEEIWNNSVNTLKKIAEEEKLPYKIYEGDAAFYGPKIDFKFKDSLGREWQLATVQLDFNMPKRFELEYTDKDGQKKNPVMIHRAIAGSLERFMSVIIEHFGGNFPFWLAPVQIKILPVAESHLEYSKQILEKLLSKNIRAELDDSSDGFGKKVRNAKKEKVPVFFVIGDAEVSAGTVTVEDRDKGNLGQKKLGSDTLLI
jgi:threonyl-tRNA synthetase